MDLCIKVQRPLAQILLNSSQKFPFILPPKSEQLRERGGYRHSCWQHTFLGPDTARLLMFSVAQKKSPRPPDAFIIIIINSVCKSCHSTQPFSHVKIMEERKTRGFLSWRLYVAPSVASPPPVASWQNSNQRVSQLFLQVSGRECWVPGLQTPFWQHRAAPGNSRVMVSEGSSWGAVTSKENKNGRQPIRWLCSLEPRDAAVSVLKRFIFFLQKYSHGRIRKCHYLNGQSN